MIITSFKANNSAIYNSLTRYFDSINYTFRTPRHYPSFVSEYYNKVLRERLPQSTKTLENSNNFLDFLNSNELNSVLPSFATHQTLLRPISSVLDEIQKITPKNITVEDLNKQYPIAVRYTDGSNVWLIERPPFYATIDYKASRANQFSKSTNASFWMPWTLMLLVINPEYSSYESYLYFNDGPLSSLDDIQIPCFHMNMYQDGRMCLNQSYVMLQQHLAATDDFSISNIYNFILNDYFTGGWNSDLGLTVFDTQARQSQTLSKVKDQIISGNFSSKPKSARTPTGRLNNRTFCKNYFSYFETLSLNEVIQLISNLKSELSSRYTNTYEKKLSSLKSQKKSLINIFSDFSYHNSEYVQKDYRIMLHPVFYEKLESSNSQDDVLETYKLIDNALYLHLSPDSQIFELSNKEIYDSKNYLENPILFVNHDYSVYDIDSQSDFNTYVVESYLNASA